MLEKIGTFLEVLILTLILCLIGAFFCGLFLYWADYSSVMCQNLFTHLGIHGLKFGDYMLGGFFLSCILTSILPNRSNKKDS